MCACDSRRCCWPADVPGWGGFEWREDSQGYEGVWAEHLERLTALQYLDLGFEPTDADVAAIATLTQLTALRLSRCGHGVQDQQVDPASLTLGLTHCT